MNFFFPLFVHYVNVKSLSRVWLCDPMDRSLPGSLVQGLFQARVLEWGAISFSRGSSRPRNWTQVSRIVGRRFTVWATREAPLFTVTCAYFMHVEASTWGLQSTRFFRVPSLGHESSSVLPVTVPLFREGKCHGRNVPAFTHLPPDVQTLLIRPAPRLGLLIEN